MEPYNFLADKVQVGGPEFFIIIIPVIHKSQRRRVIKECVHPYIDDMAGVEINRNTPGKAGARDAQILKAGIDKIAHPLVDAGGRLQKGPLS